MKTRSPRRRRPAILALGVGLTHFGATVWALRTLMEQLGSGAGGSGGLHAAVALLTFPLFYTPLPMLFGGIPHTGLYVAALNAIVWAAGTFLLVRRWLERGSAGER